jgi:hypothetical protein
MADANEKLKNLRKFLLKAASDDAFRDELQNSSASDLREKLRDTYGIDIEIPDSRLVPSKALCKELLVMSVYLEEYADVAITEALFIPIFMVVGHAMPLSVTDEEAVGATG